MFYDLSSNIWLFLARKGKFDGVLQKLELQSTRILDFWAFWFHLILGLKNLNSYLLLYLLGSLDLYSLDNTKDWTYNWFFQYKITRHFLNNLKFWVFGDFLKLEVFPEENPTQKLAGQ